jgi:hypothetical protein
MIKLSKVLLNNYKYNFKGILMVKRFLIETKHITYDSIEEKEQHKVIMLEDGWDIDYENGLYVMWQR